MRSLTFSPYYYSNQFVNQINLGIGRFSYMRLRFHGKGCPRIYLNSVDRNEEAWFYLKPWQSIAYFYPCWSYGLAMPFKKNIDDQIYYAA